MSLGIVTGAWHEYGVTYQSNATGGLKSYVDGSFNAQTDTVTFALNPWYGDGTLYDYSARFSGGSWVGKERDRTIIQGLALNATQVAAFAANRRLTIRPHCRTR